MLRETHIVVRKMLLLTFKNGYHLLSLAKMITHYFPLALNVDSTQEVELTEKACAVVYELLQVTDQARWPLAKKTNVSTAWLVESLVEGDKTVC